MEHHQGTLEGDTILKIGIYDSELKLLKKDSDCEDILDYLH